MRFANDANCFALSEATDGAAAGARVVFGVIVGTGTGGGIVVDGRVLTGPNAIAGEWGHNPLPWPRDDERPGPPCYCGKTGCIETFLSGPGLARDYREATGGDSSTPPEIAARAERGDAAAGAALARYEDRMARALADVINVLDPDVIVLGGGMSQHRAALRARAAAAGRRGCSPTASTRRCGRRCTATRAASAARPGSGAGRPVAGRARLTIPHALSRPRLGADRAHDRAAGAARRAALPGLRPRRRRARAAGRSRERAAETRGLDQPPDRAGCAWRSGSSRCWSWSASASSLGLAAGPGRPPTLPELVQGIEAAISDVVYVAVAVFFLMTIETRVKRRRALRAIHELRAIAHVIDMHQLTKDPEWVLPRGRETGIVATRAMTLFELSRYLDYCSEALSLTGKVAALYVQDFDDPVALEAVNEVEDLTTGLSRKIWQKLTVLYAMPPLDSSRGDRLVPG